MTPESSNPVLKTVKTADRFIRWVATLILQGNWYMLLVLGGVGLALLGGFLHEWINIHLFGDAPPSWFWPIYVIVMVLVFAGALAAAIANLRKPVPAPTAADLVERKAIKALRPFDRQDADVFCQLQRQTSLRDCYAAVTAERYRFGILMGASGCGKTSFLQAGLWPQLSGPASPHQGIYVRFSDREPLESIRQALASQLEIPTDWLRGESELLTLLQKAEQAAQTPLVLMLDQFEQFFAHHPRKPDRQPFIDTLCHWYRQPDATRSSLLISIRADLYHELYDLQMALGCALGPQEVMKLDKFYPTEATEILAVIADTEQLPFDRRFVAELAEQELASREDGLISPVDLQILAWMIERQKGDDLRAFNRSAFQRFGGVEGLLTRFLERTLDARIIPQQRQTAVKVLLALTDLDRQVRSGVLTLADLQAQLRETAKAEEVAEAATWLARSDVRLITPQDKDGTVGYELAHERLIPALMRLAGKELSEADRANRLLEQRVNEWLGNQQRRRYLLSWGELRQIERQRPYLIWGPKQTQKERLLHLSRCYVNSRLRTVGAVALVLVLIWGWLWFTPSGQIQRVRRMLAVEAQRYPDHVAIALVKDGRVDQGFNVVAKHILSSAPKAGFIEEVAQTALRLSDPLQAQDFLTRSLALSDSIDDRFPGPKSQALRAIAVAYGALGEPRAAVAVLEQATASVMTKPDTYGYSKSQELRAIAAAYGELGEAQAAVAVLEQATASVMTKPDTYGYSKSQELRAIAAAYGELGEAQAAVAVLEQATASVMTKPDTYGYSKSQELRAIAAAYGELGEAQAAVALLEQSMASTEVTNYTYDIRSQELDVIAHHVASGGLGLDRAMLEQAVESVDALGDAEKKAEALSTIAAAAGTLGESQEVATVLEQIIESARTIDDPWYKWQTFRNIASAYNALGKQIEAATALEEAIASVETINSARDRSQPLRNIATAFGELGQQETTAALLKEALANGHLEQSPGKVL